uniref:ATP synthase F(0) complex subunit e, mitochondrial n=1 Tax=Poecilia mexicana TaxID=48701 RepID=A0A3B3XM25_9TELE
MPPPVAVSPLIKTARYSALIAGIVYGKRRYDYLKPIAAEERRIEEEEKKVRQEQERIAKELAEGNIFTLIHIQIKSIIQILLHDSLHSYPLSHS